MTKNQALKQATETFIQSLKQSMLTSPVDLDAIEAGLLKQVQDLFDAHNDGCKGGDKNKMWPIPQTLNFSQIADIMAAIFPIRRIACAPQNTDADYDLLGIYMPEGDMEGIYVTSEDVFRKLARRFNYSLTTKEFDEVITALRDKVPRVYRTQERDLIAMNNGLFDYKTKTLLPFTPDKVFLVKSRVDYNPQAVNPVIHNPDDGTDWDVESWMSSLSDDPDVVETLWQILGAVIRPNVRWNKSAWLYSQTGNNGKGTLCELMRALCGDTSYASIPLSDFSKEFALEPITRASAIIVDENDVGTFIDKAGNLKAIITNDVIQINRKFKTPIAYQFYGFMVQCLNEYPRIKDKSDSFYRRQLFIPMTKCFTGKERTYIKDDYLHRQEVLEYVAYRVLNMDYYKLIEPASCKQALIEYKEFNDPVRQFFDELKDEFVWDLLPFTFLYDLFKSWFKINSPSGTVIGKINFINDLMQVLTGQTEWMCPDRNKKIRVTKSNMNGPEPLIISYGLTAWMNPTVKGSDPDKLATPPLSSNYRGIQRVVPGGTRAVSIAPDDADDSQYTLPGPDNED